MSLFKALCHLSLGRMPSPELFVKILAMVDLLGTECILEDGLGLAQCCDLISPCLLPVLVAGVTFSASWLQVLEVLHDCIKLRSSVLQRSLCALHLLLQGVLLLGLHRRVLLGLLKRDLLCLHVLLVILLISLILYLGISFHSCEFCHDAIKECKNTISAILRISHTCVR